MTESPNQGSSAPPPVTGPTQGTPVESAADRIARIKAQRAATTAPAEPVAAPPAAASARPATRRPTVGRASRFLAAGGAVGAGMVLVGGMAAAANQPVEPAPPAPVQRIMVVPQAAQPPTQIVVVLPEENAAW